MGEELFRILIRMAIKQAKSITDDQEALDVQMLYPNWEQQIGRSVEAGEYFQYGDKLYRVLQAHTIQEDWSPDVATSLWVLVDKEHKGTLDDPIPASLNMEYFNEKYYIEDGVIYKCIRDSGIALAYTPSQLIGSYFEVVE